MTARSSSHPPPRNTSRTAQNTIQNLQNYIGVHISAKTVQTYPQDISTQTGIRTKKTCYNTVSADERKNYVFRICEDGQENSFSVTNKIENS